MTERIDLQERISSYNVNNQIALPSHRIVVNLKPIKTPEFTNLYLSKDDPFGKKEFKLGVALTKDLASMSDYFRRAAIYQSKLVVELELGASMQDVLKLYSEFALSYAYRSKLSDPVADVDVYCIPNWDLPNAMKYFQMMWAAFVARTLGEEYGVASKQDRSKHHTEILDSVLQLNPEALNQLPDGLRYGIEVNKQGKLNHERVNY